MARFFSSLLLTTAAIAAALTASAEDVVHVGAGSYLTRPPAGTKQPQSQIYRAASLHGPMPTNRWWSSLAWVPLSDTMYPHPLAVRAEKSGLRVAYPGPDITANKDAIMGVMPGGGEDLVIGHSGVESFAEARVEAFSDWFVTALFEAEGKKLHASFGHGSPYVFVTVEGGNPTLTFKTPPKVWSGSAGDAVLGITVRNRHYGLFAPTGSTWSDLAAAKWTADTKGRPYFAVAVLPDDKPETLVLFKKHAYSHVTDTRVAWKYDEKRCAVQTTYTFTTKAFEGADTGALTALYPHQWTHTTAKLLDHGYDSVRGPMKLVEGGSFATEMTYPGVLPSLPVADAADKASLANFIDAEAKGEARTTGDTYWLGKSMGKWSTLIPIAEQIGDAAAVEMLTSRTRSALENFLTATDAQGAPKKKDGCSFFYDADWGSLIGYPASYGSDDQLNDHHFHYGYFIRAAGEIARRDSAWAADAKWGGMVKLLVRDIANTDRSDALFPFLRNFDPYAGHSWASGHARFADGNNNESSSEAVNAWYGLILFGEATGDRALRDLGVWLFTTEVEAINDYWFDVTGKFHHQGFPASVVTMIWGGKGANGTWFSGNPEMVHGINWLPVTGASLYLGRYPDYCVKNYTALIAENKADDEKKATKTGRPNENKDGTLWDAWADIIWMYRALSDSKDALAQFQARKPDLKPEGGNSMANVYNWLTTLDAYGQVDRTVTADAPFYAVFQKAGHRTHVAWNIGTVPRVVTFSDGVSVSCPAHSRVVK